MEVDKILKADYLDILFEGKNKDYGGYILRKNYKKRMLISVFIAISVLSLLFASAFIRPKEEAVVAVQFDIKDVELINLPTQDRELPPPPPPSIKPPPPVKSTVKVTAPVIKPNDEVLEEDKPVPLKPDDNKVVGPANIEGTDNPFAIDPNLNTTRNNGDGEVFIPQPTPEPEVFRSVEQMPGFPGGDVALLRYLSNNINYPSDARRNQIEGRVILEFVVDEHGQVGNVNIVHDIGGGCGEEAKRVVERMPKWSPGRQNGKPVKVYYTLPVSFRLQ